MDQNTILPILQKIPLLAELNEQDHAEIIKHITLQYFPKDYVLFREGDMGDKMYIIKSGLIKVYHESTPQDKIAELGANEVLGEMSLFRDAPRNASAKTEEESEVFILEKTDFYNLVLKNAEIANKLSEEFLARVQENNQKNQ